MYDDFMSEIAQYNSGIERFMEAKVFNKVKVLLISMCCYGNFCMPILRWPYIPVQEEDKVQRLWLNWVSLRFKLGKAVRETVGTLSSKYYPDGKIAMNILDKWIEREYPTLLFVEDELRDLSFHQEKSG